MADFRPFPAWRYNTEKLDPQKFIAPPYDVISPTEQEKLYERSPYNCIRLILNREETSDTEQNNRYLRARNFFKDWQAQKILIQEEQPSFYLYQQIFDDPSGAVKKERFALLGRLKLEPFEKGIVIPHEKTLAKPRQDRRKLLEATQTNFSPIFGLYEDTKNEMDAVRRQVKAQKPLFQTADDQGVQHVLWAIHDIHLLETIHFAMGKKQIYIADGHHRYQTALEYARDMHQSKQIPADTEMPFDFVYMALVEFRDPGLVLLPTHRILLPFEGFDGAKMISAIKSFFKVESMPPEKLRERLKLHTESPEFGIFLNPAESYLVTLQDLEKARQNMPAAKPPLWYRLDVNLVSYLIFDKILGLPESRWESALRFTHSNEEAIAAFKNQRAGAVFLLKAPPVEILRDMGQVRELMPQKSTYFYPKLASGLLFYAH